MRQQTIYKKTLIQITLGFPAITSIIVNQWNPQIMSYLKGERLSMKHNTLCQQILFDTKLSGRFIGEYTFHPSINLRSILNAMIWINKKDSKFTSEYLSSKIELMPRTVEWTNGNSTINRLSGVVCIPCSCHIFTSFPFIYLHHVMYLSSVHLVDGLSGALVCFPMIFLSLSFLSIFLCSTFFHMFT